MLGLAGAWLGMPAWAAEPARLPFQMLSGKIFTTVSINGVKVEALVDSGAAISALDQAFAKQIGIRSLPGALFTGVQGGRMGGMSGPVTLEAGGARVELKRTAVIDYGDFSAGFQRPFQAVLGREIFDRFVADFDFTAQTLSLHPRDEFTAPAGVAAVALFPVKDRMTADIVVESGAPLRALIDLGSEAPLILSPGPATARRLLEGRTVSTTDLGGYGRTVVAKVATVRTLALGGVVFRDVPIQVAPRSIGFDANLGLPVLKRFRLWLDFGGRRMWLAPGADVTAAFLKDRTGLSGRIDGAVLRITHVAKGGPAERVGWRAGDVVTAIDGEAAAFANGRLGPGAKPGQVVTFTMAAGETRRLVLADYY